MLRAKSCRVDEQAGFFLADERWLNHVEEIQENDDGDRNPYEPQQNSTHNVLLSLIAVFEPSAAGYGSRFPQYIFATLEHIFASSVERGLKCSGALFEGFRTGLCSLNSIWRNEL